MNFSSLEHGVMIATPANPNRFVQSESDEHGQDDEISVIVQPQRQAGKGECNNARISKPSQGYDAECCWKTDR
jgi:hypothetical protein